MINGVPGMTAAPGSRYPAIYVLYNTIDVFERRSGSKGRGHRIRMNGARVWD